VRSQDDVSLAAAKEHSEDNASLVAVKVRSEDDVSPNDTSQW